MRAAILMAIATVACSAGVAGAQSDPDSALRGFLKSQADSSDRYFGLSAAPLDTTGLDSALAYGLAHPARPRRRVAFSVGPWLSFTRVDGALYGGSAGDSVGRRFLDVSGRLGYASASETWLGRGRIQKSWWRRGPDPRWNLDLQAGRFTEGIDPDHEDRVFSTIRALVFGTDRSNYLRRDGFTIALERDSPQGRAGVTFRDQLESPIDARTSWNLLDHDPVVPGNLPARPGRARELGLSGTLRIGRLPAWLEGVYRTSGASLGSDFEYRRWRASMAADLTLGRFATFIPELRYGRLTGEPVPQASFFLGGQRSVRSVPRQSMGGSRLAFARFELIAAQDLLAFAHGPNSALPLQAGMFGGIGSVGGDDPLGGPPRSGGGWPDRGEWLSEMGVSLLYRPGIPDPLGFVRIDYAIPLGPGDRGARILLHYSRALPVRGFDPDR